MSFDFVFKRALLIAAWVSIGAVGGGYALAADPPAAKFVKASIAFSASSKVADSDLKRIAGKADLSQTVIANNTSNVSDNSVNGNSTTGTLSFGTNAFSQIHGLAVVSANTGNNVSINSSLNVTISMQPK
jgi:hypothetical protein